MAFTNNHAEILVFGEQVKRCVDELAGLCALVRFLGEEEGLGESLM